MTSRTKTLLIILLVIGVVLYNYLLQIFLKSSVEREYTPDQEEQIRIFTKNYEPKNK